MSLIIDYIHLFHSNKEIFYKNRNNQTYKSQRDAMQLVRKNH